jgi:hypothetical protein
MVHGALRMQPAHPGVSHTLSFPQIDENAYVGGMAMAVQDIGVWVMGAGALQLHGSARTSWVRTAGATGAGDRTLQLAATPLGWQSLSSFLCK